MVDTAYNLVDFNVRQIEEEVDDLSDYINELKEKIRDIKKQYIKSERDKDIVASGWDIINLWGEEYRENFETSMDILRDNFKYFAEELEDFIKKNKIEGNF